MAAVITVQQVKGQGVSGIRLNRQAGRVVNDAPEQQEGIGRLGSEAADGEVVDVCQFIGRNGAVEVSLVLGQGGEFAMPEG